MECLSACESPRLSTEEKPQSLREVGVCVQLRQVQHPGTLVWETGRGRGSGAVGASGMSAVGTGSAPVHLPCQCSSVPGTLVGGGQGSPQNAAQLRDRVQGRPFTQAPPQRPSSCGTVGSRRAY